MFAKAVLLGVCLVSCTGIEGAPRISKRQSSRFGGYQLAQSPQQSYSPPVQSPPSYSQPQYIPTYPRSQPQPSYSQQPPIYPKPQPTYTRSQSTYPQSTPSNSQPQPSYSQPQPSYSQPQPSNFQPQPSYSQPQPSHSQAQPSYPQPQPSYSQPQPSYSQPQPSYSQPPPTYPQPQQPYGQIEEEGMPFNYGYQVKDGYSGLDYSHNSDSDGEVTQGEYRVLLPDGRTQIVTYRATKEDGFRAQVRYEGEIRTEDRFQSGAFSDPIPSYLRPDPIYRQDFIFQQPQSSYQQQ